MNKFEEIYKSWKAASNPTNEQDRIAKLRLAKCQNCEHHRHNEMIDYYYCSACGCPISKKIFSPLPGKEVCPKSRWEV